MFLSKDNNLNRLSYGFSMLFIAIGGIQQYFTPYFSSLGNPNMGFHLLLIIYASIFISNFSSSYFINRFGFKNMIFTTALIYLFAMVLILFTTEYISYIGASLLGLGGAILWNSQNGYLLKISNEKNRGATSGFFLSVYQTGFLLGVLFLGLLLELYSFKISFIIVLFIGLLSLLLFLKLDNLESEVKSKKSFSFSFKTITLFKVSIVNSFTYHLLYGLSFSLVPLHIYTVTNSSFLVAIVSALFYLFPMLFSKKIGVYSDKKGRGVVAIFGIILSIIGLLLFHFSTEIIMLIISSAILAFAMTLLSTVFIAIQGDISDPETQIYVTSVFMFFKYTGLIVGIAVGMIFGIKLAYLILMGVIFLTLLLGHKLMTDIPLLQQKIVKEIKSITTHS